MVHLSILRNYKIHDTVFDLIKLYDIIKHSNELAMKYYKKKNIIINIKDDKSPVTNADYEINQYITKELSNHYKNIPIISEEIDNLDYHARKNHRLLWFIDPIDGTSEYIKGTDEFTVNLGLCLDNIPVMGFVGVPAKKLIYFGVQGLGSYKTISYDLPINILQIRAERSSNKKKVIVSNNSMKELLNKQLKLLGDVDVIYCGSSYKFLQVADGTVDAYLRVIGSSEWDTVAGDAILRASGGTMYELLDHNNGFDQHKEQWYLNLFLDNKFLYNKEVLKNPMFFAVGSSKSSE